MINTGMVIRKLPYAIHRFTAHATPHTPKRRTPVNETDRAPIEDTRFGAITVRQDGQDRLEVDGAAIPA